MPWRTASSTIRNLVLLDIKMPFLDGLAAARSSDEEELADTIDYAHGV